jgi:hypothetical protein
MSANLRQPESDHPSRSNDEVKSTWRLYFAPPYVFMSRDELYAGTHLWAFHRICLFIYGFLNDVISSSKYVTSICGIVIELQRSGRKRWWPDLRDCPGICIEGLRKTRTTSDSITTFITNN